MLVLTRRRGESIVIGDLVVVQVLETRGRRVRLSIDAPREIRIRRAEVPRREVAGDLAASAEPESAVHA